MSLDRAASIDDLRRRARRRLPRFVFDFLDGGAEDESNLRRNREAFEALCLVPRYLVDVSDCRHEVAIFGKRYAVPFAIAPMGLLNLIWPDSDLALARLAGEKNMVFLVSTNSTTAIEQVAAAARGNAWFQLYVFSDEDLTESLLAKAESAGCEVLVLTLDVPVAGKRDRDIRNRFQVPFRWTPSVIADLALHPYWSLATLAAGNPTFANLTEFAGQDDVQSLAQFQASRITGAYDWDDLKRLRDRWKGKLLLKGVMRPEDAVLAREAGCDGVIVSNHGGRQAAYAPAAVEALPGIVAALQGTLPVMLDSGLRRGADAIRAKALGADLVFFGRAFAYGAGAGGPAGCRRAYDILESELTLALGQLGRPDFAAIDGSVLFGAVGRHPSR